MRSSRPHQTAAGAATRRQWMVKVASGLLIAPGAPGWVGAAADVPKKKPAHTLSPLPYPENALAPVISAYTMMFHYGGHHKAYVVRLNQLLADHPEYADLSLEGLVAETAGDEEMADLFTAAAQHWNHSFFWKSLKPRGGGEPPAALKQRIGEDFGSLAAMKKALLDAAEAQRASGWLWLVLDQNKLQVTRTPDADLPLIRGQRPLLALDLWEHAYYLDYQTRRADYVSAVFERLWNWDFALQNLPATPMSRPT